MRRISEGLMEKNLGEVRPTPPKSKSAKGVAGEEAENRFAKTRLCIFGPQCHLADACTFAHSYDELRVRPDLTKTGLCTKFRRQGVCRRGDACPYAHGREDLRVRQPAGPPPLPMKLLSHLPLRPMAGPPAWPPTTYPSTYPLSMPPGLGISDAEEIDRANEVDGMLGSAMPCWDGFEKLGSLPYTNPYCGGAFGDSGDLNHWMGTSTAAYRHLLGVHCDWSSDCKAALQ
mmetsp:Transcript_61831/g.138055  ORF Transcript_61831/g.138055 Transcript_61831/m.138055 type:complete len:230 (-) Transcript_61831:13-702(-)